MQVRDMQAAKGAAATQIQKAYVSMNSRLPRFFEKRVLPEDSHPSNVEEDLTISRPNREEYSVGLLLLRLSRQP
jgi:hypothetical protein